MLRRKLHDANAVIHIVGFRFGAEPNRPAAPLLHANGIRPPPGAHARRPEDSDRSATAIVRWLRLSAEFTFLRPKVAAFPGGRASRPRLWLSIALMRRERGAR